MRKPLTFQSLGLSDKSINHIDIVLEATSKNQLFRISKLSKHISDRQLSDALDLLEKRSITADTAILAIASIQGGAR